MTVKSVAYCIIAVKSSNCSILCVEALAGINSVDYNGSVIFENTRATML
jgi:hypothetical protein